MAEKGPNEIYCRSCGETIKRQAEICPHCGVRNEAAESAGGLAAQEHVHCRSCGNEMHREAEICPDCGVANPLQSGSGTRQPTGGNTASAGGTATGNAGATTGSAANAPHDPSRYTTSVSENWKWGVGASVVLWILGFALPTAGGLAAIAILAAWGLMPIAMYLDREWLRANTYWDPNLPLWVLGSLIPPFNVLIGIAYLVRRHGTEVADEADRDPAADDEDDPLEELQGQYSRGEIDEVEFERRVETLLETEDRETAESLLDADDGERSIEHADTETRGSIESAETRREPARERDRER